MQLHTPIFKRYLAPADDAGTDTGGTDTAADAVVDDDDHYASLPIEERRRLRGDDAGDDSKSEATATVNTPADEPDKADAGADAEDASTVEKGSGIPRARFNEVIEQRKALQQEVEALRAQVAAQRPDSPAAPSQGPAPLTIPEAEERYAVLMVEGDTKAAAALRMQINAAIEEAAYARFSQASASERAQAQVEATADTLLAEFPWLNDPAGAEALELIEASVLMKMGRGVPRDQALAQAVKAIAPRFAPAGATPPPAVDPRTERANRRGAMDSQLQPAALQAGMGNRASAPQIDALKLSDDEYMNLPEAERKKLRGD